MATFLLKSFVEGDSVPLGLCVDQDAIAVQKQVVLVTGVRALCS